MTTSLFQTLQDNGYTELNFPSQPEQQSPPNEYSPTSTPFASTNGLTYVYDGNKASWTLLRGNTATQDWVNQQLLFKLDKTGGRMIGQLDFATQSDSASNPNIIVHSSGKLEFTQHGDKKLVFKSGGSGVAGVVMSGNTESLHFFDNKISVRTPISFDSVPENGMAFMNHSYGEDTEIPIMKLGESSSAAKSAVIIGSNGGFIIKTLDNKLFSAYGSGTVKVYKRFKGPDDILQMTPDSLEVSDVYVNKLDNNPSDKSLATVSYVKKGAFKPGYTVFAPSEGEAQQHGLWHQDFRYYIKTSN